MNCHESSQCSRVLLPMTGRTCDGPHPPLGPAHPWPEDRRCYCQRCETAGLRWAWSLPEMTQEAGTSGRCRLGHPVTALADTGSGPAVHRGHHGRRPRPGLAPGVERGRGGLQRGNRHRRRCEARHAGPARQREVFRAAAGTWTRPFPGAPKELYRTNEKLPETGSWSQLNPTGTRSHCFGRRRYRVPHHNQESR